MERTIYFDNAATTFPKPEVVYNQMDKFYRNFGVNAGRGSYALAREASRIIDKTRCLVSEIVNIDDANKVIFTASATQAMNQIINGLQWDEGKTVYVTPFEHNAIMRPLEYIRKKYNIRIEVIPFDNETFELDTDKLKFQFSMKHPDYIFISHVSNVTGYILPVDEIVNEAQKYNSIITLDCSQSMGLIPINVKKLNLDYFVFAGHKTLYGPFGIAGYIDNSKIILSEVLTGGTGSDSLNLSMPKETPGRYEAGSHNIQAIAGLNAALEWIKIEKIENIKEKEVKLTKKIIDGLKDIYGLKLYVHKNELRHVGIVSFNIEGYKPSELGQILDQDFNVAVRTGYHCAPLVHDFLKTREKGGTVRVSLGYFNNMEQIDYLLECLQEL